MSDFLTNLAARALHATPFVKPRVASRFEAPQSSQQFLSYATLSTEQESCDESRVPSAPPATNAHSEPHDLARATPNIEDTTPLRSLSSPEQPAGNARQSISTPRETDDEITSPIMARIAWPITSPIASPIRSQPTPEQPVAIELPRGSSSRESHVASTSPFGLETVIARPAPVGNMSRHDARERVDSPIRDNKSMTRDHAENTGDRVSGLEMNGMERQPIPDSPRRSEPPPHLAAKITTSGPLIAIPRLTPAPAATPSQNLDRSAAAPTIRVTIGRVEVRANLPPAPAPPRATPARASSVLSLDEYIKRRTEGRT